MNIKDFLFLHREIPPVGNEFVFHIGSFGVSNSTMFALLIAIIILILGLTLKKDSLIPSKARAFVEIVYEAIHAQIKSITVSEKHTERVFAIIGAVFLYIGMSNYLGLLPGLGSITIGGHPFFRVPTSDFNTTIGLSFGALIIIQIVAIYDNGGWVYFNKFIPITQLRQDFKKGMMAPLYALITILITTLELIGEVTRSLSIALRLFGNLYAGDVLTFVLLGIFSIGLPAVWTGLGLLIAIVQTIVFGSLITIFYLQAVSHGAHESVEAH